MEQTIEVENPSLVSRSPVKFRCHESGSADGRSTPSADFDTDTTVDSTGEEVVTEHNCIRRLECAAQKYAWGRMGSSSLVARMKASQSNQFRIDEETPYAELWLGTHPNGMSEIALPQGKQSLLEYVRSSPALHCGVGSANDLPFLFKVLSIRKVLSIQAHPDKRLAEKLHSERPKIYKDPNHKPEMAVALTDDFEAMSGFRCIQDIHRHLQEYPEFAALIDEEAKAEVEKSAQVNQGNAPKEVLQRLFKSYMETDDDVVKQQLEALLTRLNAKVNLEGCDELILRLADQFPGDCGVFAPLLFNHMKLKKGEAFFIGANEPHAYIQGEILECMACSDNVVRAGLTPKLKDVDTLVDMLTYKTTLPEVTTGTKVDSCTRAYAPPVDDFCIEVVEVPANQSYELSYVASPSVLLTLEGSGKLQQESIESLSMAFGQAAFMSANTVASVVAGDDGLRIVRARSNVSH